MTEPLPVQLHLGRHCADPAGPASGCSTALVEWAAGCSRRRAENEGFPPLSLTEAALTMPRVSSEDEIIELRDGRPRSRTVAVLLAVSSLVAGLLSFAVLSPVAGREPAF